MGDIRLFYVLAELETPIVFGGHDHLSITTSPSQTRAAARGRVCRDPGRDELSTHSCGVLRCIAAG